MVPWKKKMWSGLVGRARAAGTWTSIRTRIARVVNYLVESYRLRNSQVKLFVLRARPLRSRDFSALLVAPDADEAAVRARGSELARELAGARDELRGRFLFRVVDQRESRVYRESIEACERALREGEGLMAVNCAVVVLHGAYKQLRGDTT